MCTNRILGATEGTHVGSAIALWRCTLPRRGNVVCSHVGAFCLVGAVMPRRVCGSFYFYRPQASSWSAVGGAAQTLPLAIGRKNRQMVSF